MTMPVKHFLNAHMKTGHSSIAVLYPCSYSSQSCICSSRRICYC